MEALIRQWAPTGSSRSSATSPKERLGVDPAWVKQHRDSGGQRIDHFFHLAAIYDMTADDETNEAMERRRHPARRPAGRRAAGRLPASGQLGRGGR